MAVVEVEVWLSPVEKGEKMIVRESGRRARGEVSWI